MANCILSYPNYVDASPAVSRVDFSGGWWRPEIPLSNLRDNLLIRRARSVNLALSSTRFWVDLGVSRDVRVAAIPRMTSSRNTKIRVRGFLVQDENAPVQADSGWQDLYPVIYPFGSLYWGHPSWWDGKISEEDSSIFPMPFLHVFDNTIIARYWLFEIDDTGSPIGYVEVPRVFLAPGWQPSLNFVYGASAGYENRTEVQESLGGAEFFDIQESRRIVRFNFTFLPEDEALTWAFDMQRRLGIHGQLFFIFDPDDTVHRHRRSFLARMRQLSPLEYATFLSNSATFELSEVIA